MYNNVYLSSSLIGEQLHHRKFVSSLLIGATHLLARWHSICSADTKILTEYCALLRKYYPFSSPSLKTDIRFARPKIRGADGKGET